MRITTHGKGNVQWPQRKKVESIIQNGHLIRVIQQLI